MKELQDYLKKNFKKNYSEAGKLMKLSFEPIGRLEQKLLIVGSEHGDKPFGTKAMARLMKELKEMPLLKTQVDFIPVIDMKGYPSCRTIIGDEGLGRPMYLDGGYRSKDVPEEIKDLMKQLTQEYDMAVQLNAVFREEAPLMNGYFAIPQVKAVVNDGKQIIKIHPGVKDVVGSVINAVKEAGFDLLTRSDKGHVGDGHVLYAEGLVLPGFKDGEKVEFRTRNAFALTCENKGLSAVILYALSAGFGTLNDDAVNAHKAALDALVRLYEK